MLKAILLILAVASIRAVGQMPSKPPPLTNIDVVTMVKEGLSPAIIKAKIKSSDTAFDTSSQALKQLKTLGVPESLVVFMIEQKRPPAVEPQPTSQPTQSGISPPQTATVLSAKRPGIPRIGIVTTQTLAPLDQDEAVRAQFYEVLYGNRETSSTEAILMREKLDRSISLEAAHTKCDYLLFVSLNSTIESAVKKKGNFLQKGLQAAAQGLGAASKLSGPTSLLSGLTYKSYQMTDSLQASTTLLDSIAEATEKNDRIGINFRLVHVPTNEIVISQTLKEVVAQKKREPILQNLLIQLGNDVVNAIPFRSRL